MSDFGWAIVIIVAVSWGYALLGNYANKLLKSQEDKKRH